MSWMAPIYAQLPDDAAKLALASVLGIDVLPDGTLSSGNHNFALLAIDAPWQTPPVVDADGSVITPGVRQSGLWFMGRLNDTWTGAEAAMATLQAAGALRDLSDPPVLFAGTDDPS